MKDELMKTLDKADEAFKRWLAAKKLEMDIGKAIDDALDEEVGDWGEIERLDINYDAVRIAIKATLKIVDQYFVNKKEYVKKD